MAQCANCYKHIDGSNCHTCYECGEPLCDDCYKYNDLCEECEKNK